MPISQDTITELRRSHGADSTLGTPPTDTDAGTAPYGMTLVGAINKVERIAEHMDEYGLAYADLPADKQAEFDRAHEALQFHIANLNNVLTGMVGADDSITLPNGASVSLPLAATSGSNSASIPNKP